MKVMKDEDLLSLHYQIEKAEIKQKKLEDLLDEESDKLKKSKKSNRLFGSFSLVLFLLTIFLVANAFYFSKSQSKSSKAENNELSLVKQELISAKQELEVLKKEKVSLKEIKDLYLYRSLIKKDTVYSVQLKAFSAKNTPAISEKYTNALIYSDTSFYKMSLGIFETLSEAQDFRKTLIASGFDKRIFVISYKDGKRLKIEEFQ
ncbi:hypothetical protein ATO12_01255 [Aquimarina atlantica]|uniref:SPOR domain-containing protein n=2 Tax=Aquimarina atlantica TaxID=1317122 RepID=A0A023BZP2_9FLAO|nr:hypothetical protein ATO12_01255 [Aquimarina atlantica]